MCTSVAGCAAETNRLLVRAVDLSCVNLFGARYFFLSKTYMKVALEYEKAEMGTVAVFSILASLQ